MFSDRTAGWQRWEGVLKKGCRWLELRQRKTGERRDQRCWDCASLMTTRTSAAVPSSPSDIGLGSGFFVEWLKKTSEAARLMEAAASAGVSAESEPTIKVEVGVETTFVGVGNCRFISVSPGWHTASAVALPTWTTLPRHLERHTERKIQLRISAAEGVFCLQWVHPGSSGHLWWGWQGSVLESLSENVPSGHCSHLTFEEAVPEETPKHFLRIYPWFSLSKKTSLMYLVEILHIQLCMTCTGRTWNRTGLWRRNTCPACTHTWTLSLRCRSGCTANRWLVWGRKCFFTSVINFIKG